MISSLRGGGSERQTILLLRYLDRTRFQPHLYLTHQTGDLLSEVPPDVPIHGPELNDLSSGFYFPGRILQRQVKSLSEIIRRHRIDVVYDRTFHMTMVAGPACERTGTPRVSTIVSPPDLALPMVEQRFVAFKRRRLAKAYRRSRHVVAVSSVAARSAESFYRLRKSSVRVIPNPVEVNRLRPEVACDLSNRDRDPSNQDSATRDPRLTLVCVGRMSEEKGHRDLLEAIVRFAKRAVPSVRLRLWLIGDGPLHGELQNLARKIERESIAIEFLGQQPSAVPWIAQADALIAPSHFEGMPNVVLEAMALGTAVIATRAGGTIDLERDEATIWWCEPKQPDSLANAIDRFVTHPDQRRRRIDAAMRMVRQYHDPEKIVRQIESLLRPDNEA